MNLELRDPFEGDLPDSVGCMAACQNKATCCLFNKSGTHLAIGHGWGLSDIVVWDLYTHEICRELKGHQHNITSLSWTCGSNHILSSSLDKRVMLWDVDTARPLTSFELSTAALSAQPHPKNENLCVVCPFMKLPVLLNLETQSLSTLPVPDMDEQHITRVAHHRTHRNANQYYMTAAFDHTGAHVVITTSKGDLYFFDTNTHQMVSHTPVSSPIIHIQFSGNGKFLLVNSTDCMLRIYKYTAPTLEYLNAFSDHVNRTPFVRACFSGDADYVAAGSRNNGHKIYIFHREFGELQKILEGDTDFVTDISWNTLRPIIATCTSGGSVFVWSQSHDQNNWASYAPDFTELEHNEEYEELETEFDAVPEGPKNDNVQACPQDAEVDVLSVHRPRLL